MSTIYFYEPRDNVPFDYLLPSRWSGELPSPYETDLLPQHYLEFAISDLEDATSRGVVNSFGNVKRMLHFMIDSLLHQYGAFSSYKKANFPEKLRLLDAIGILPITLMRNLNVERNLLEHEYAVPSRKRVEEAVDVAKLILMATERLVEQIPTEVVIGWSSPKKHIVLQLEPYAGEIRLFGLKAKGRYKKVNGINCFTGPLRSFFGNELTKGASIAKTPWKIIPIKKANESNWVPIVRELIDIQRKNNDRGSKIDQETATVTIPVTIPLPDLPQKSWASLLNEFLEKSKNEGENTDGEKKTKQASPRRKVQSTRRITNKSKRK